MITKEFLKIWLLSVNPAVHCIVFFWHPESLTLNNKLMVNQTLVTDQLFLDTFIITSSGQ